MVPNIVVTIVEPISSNTSWKSEVKGRALYPIKISGNLICPDHTLFIRYQLTRTNTDWLVNLELAGFLTRNGDRHNFVYPEQSTVSSFLNPKRTGKNLVIEKLGATIFNPSAAYWPITPWPLMGLRSFKECEK